MKRKLWQGDIIQYMASPSYLGISQKSIAYELAGTDLTNSVPKVNRLVKGTLKTGFPGIEAKHVYKELIVRELEEKKMKPDVALSGLKNFLREHDIEFEVPPDVDTSSYEAYIYAVLEAGLPVVKQPPSLETEKQKNRKPPTNFQGRPTLHPQNFLSIDSFTGRENILDQMAQLLETRQTVVLSGIGGIGKTSITNEYAYRHAAAYQVQQRIVCGNAIRSFRQMILATQFDGLDETGIEEDAKYLERMRLLKRMDASTLLILDNIDEWPEDDEIFNDLRTNSKLHIIITTRLRDKFDSVYTIPVDVLEESEQMKLFEHHLQHEVEQQDQEIVAEILKYVDGHTLLIELIAKTIDNGSLYYSEMYEFLHSGEDRAEISDIPIQVQKDNYNKMDKMWNFVRRILFNIEPLSEEQRNTLQDMTLLPAEGTSRRFFLRKLSSQSADILTNLEKRSWSIRERQGEVVKLHPVIREAVKEELHPTCLSCRPFLDRLKQLLEARASDESGDSDNLCGLIQSVIHTLDFVQPPYEENLCFLAVAATYYRKKSEYDYYGALDIYAPALKLLEIRESESSPDAMAESIYQGAGWCYQQIADYKDSIRYYLAAVNTVEQGSRQLAKIYRRLGEVYRKDSNYDSALDYDERALALFTDNYDIAEVKNAMGVVYINMGEPEKAKDLYMEARTLWEACQAENPSEDLYQKLAYANHNIGTAWQKLNQFAKALEQHEKALNIRKSHQYPESQRDVASSYAWLANDCMALAQNCKETGELEQADTYMVRAKKYIDESVNIRKDLLGEDHPDYAWTLDTLSRWHEAKGDVDQAIKVMNDIVRIRRLVLSDGHQYTKEAIERLNNLKLRK